MVQLLDCNENAVLVKLHRPATTRSGVKLAKPNAETLTLSLRPAPLFQRRAETLANVAPPTRVTGGDREARPGRSRASSGEVPGTQALNPEERAGGGTRTVPDIRLLLWGQVLEVKTFLTSKYPDRWDVWRITRIDAHTCRRFCLMQTCAGCLRRSPLLPTAHSPTRSRARRAPT